MAYCMAVLILYKALFILHRTLSIAPVSGVHNAMQHIVWLFGYCIRLFLYCTGIFSNTSIWRTHFFQPFMGRVRSRAGPRVCMCVCVRVFL